MELSVCIPVYQHDVADLVNELVRQGDELEIAYEICLLDDCSAEIIQIKNRAFAKSHKTVRYEELPQNVGRSKIRNKLAEMAEGNWLIFLDNDLSIKKKDFLKTYLSNIEEKYIPQLVCGGYEFVEPTDFNKSLRYTYGKKIEQISQRNGQWHSPFLSGNFLVPKDVFSYIQFDEDITQYGYEDLLFQLDFEKMFNEEVRIIYNPVKIVEIDDNENFLNKTNQAIENLAQLYQSGRVVIQDDIRLLIAYQQLKNKNLVQACQNMGKLGFPLLLFNLNHPKPNLKLFQFYKLLRFIDALQDNKNHTN